MFLFSLFSYWELAGKTDEMASRVRWRFPARSCEVQWFPAYRSAEAEDDGVSAVQGSPQVWWHGVPWYDEQTRHGMVDGAWFPRTRCRQATLRRCQQRSSSGTTEIPSGRGRWSNGTSRPGRRHTTGQRWKTYGWTRTDVGAVTWEQWLEKVKTRWKSNNWTSSKRFSRTQWLRLKSDSISWE